MVYYILKDRKMRAVHEHEIPGIMRCGRTVYAIADDIKLSYHPRYVWVACWLDPKALLAVEIQMKSAGYALFAERAMCWGVRWQHGRYSRAPKETIRPRATDPGRIWLQVRVPDRWGDATSSVKEEILMELAQRAEAASDMIRVATNPSGEIFWQETPPLGLAAAKRRVEWDPGDLIYVPDDKVWGRLWNYLPDRHYIEIGQLYAGMPEDPKTRDLHRIGVYPAARCVRIEQVIQGSSVGDATADIAQKAGHGGYRWSTGQIAAMS